MSPGAVTLTEEAARGCSAQCVHRPFTSREHNALMSMAEPLLPHAHAGDESTAAAEPGAAGPEPQYPEEPDVLPTGPAGPAETQDAAAADEPSTPVFRRPTPGERLHPDELAAELGTDEPA